MECGPIFLRMTASAVVLVLLLEPFDGTHAQSAPIIYPGAGQSMDQQARDETDCRNWATQQTGVYPYQAPPTYYGNSNEGMPVAGGAARGAAMHAGARLCHSLGTPHSGEGQSGWLA
jgi:hypothetical protein